MHKKNSFFSANEDEKEDCELLEIKFKDNKIRNVGLDNIVSLKNGRLFEVTKLFRKNQ